MIFSQSKKVLVFFVELLEYLWPQQKKLKRYFILSVVFNFLSILSSVLIPLFFKYIVDSFEKIYLTQFPYWFFLVLASYVILWSLGKLSFYLREITMFPVMEEAIYNLSSRLYKHIQFLPLEKHLTKKTGELGGVIESALNNFPSIVWVLSFSLIPFFIEVTFILAITSYFCGFLYSIVLLVIFLLIMKVTHSSFIKSVFLLRRSNLTHLASFTKIVDGFLNFSNVKYFNQYGNEFQKIDGFLKKRKEVEIRALFKIEQIHIYQIAILSLGFLILTLLSGTHIYFHQSTLGNFIMLNTYILSFSGAIENFSQFFRIINQSFVKMEKAINFLKKPILIKRGEIKLKKEDPLHIVFENVWFGYKKKYPLLKGVSFEVESYESIAIVGETGSGKSTIFGLLLRFLDPWSGRIMINGHDINDIDQESLIDITGVTPQNVTLFHDNILNNILYANPHASKKEVEDAITFALLEDTIRNLPLGLETKVGEQGSQLSGGEKQRIGIARAFLRSPHLCLFDEATSSLDRETEKKILDNINSLKATKIFITHRPYPLIHCKKVFLLENGKMHEKKL